jgi:subtilisin-like proprotein convertase family protein
LDLGAWYSNCPDTVICSAPPESNTYCYKNGDTRTFHYQVEVGETVTLNFSAGSLDLNDAVNFYSGSSNLGTAISGGNFSGSLAGQNITSSGNELYFEIITVGSNSCFDGGQSTPWAWTVGCTPDCVPADGAVSYLSPAYTCDPNEFSLEFLLIDLGYEDGIGTAATSATLEWTVDGGSPGSQALTLADLFTPFNFGPFPLGSDVNVVIAHSTNSDCDKNLGIFTQADVCPPLNDECTSAETLNIVSVDGCPAGNITGTTAFATSSVGGTIPPPSCNVGTGNLQDVWYTFNTASFQSPLLMNFSAGTALSYGVELFDAGDAPDCLGALIGCLPNSPAGINFTGFGTNEQYYLRVFTYDGTGTAGTFNLCLAASSCPTPTGIASSGITDNQATITWTGPFSNYIIEYGPTVSFNTPGTGATPGPGGTIITAFQSPLTISGLTASTQYTFYMRRDCGSPDGFSLNSGGLIFTTQAPPPPSFPYITEVPFCGDQGQGPIPDNGCGTNTSQILDLFFPMPPGTTLGTDVVVESVDLVITHTYRGDLNISLISPSGQVRNLIVANGGDGFADYGDVVSCIPLKLKDGAPATFPAANAPTGTYAPAQPLSTMTGPVGTGSGDWRLRICDLFGGDIGTVQYVGLNFAPCVGPNFSTNVTTNCGALEYSVDVTINLMGSAASYDITNSLNGSIVTAGSTGTYTVGPFPAGTPVDLTLNHDANAVCTATALGLVGLCPPDNDLCGDAIMISCNSVTSGTTSGATAEAPAPAFCGTGLTSPGVWYTVAGFDGDMEVTTCGSSSPYDTKLNVYTGGCGSWTCVGGNDDSSPDCGFFLSRFAWTGSSAETYYILVQGFNGETGDFDLTVTCGDLNPACTENGLNLEFQNATNPGGVTWVIEDETGSVVAVSGTNVFPADAVGTQAICLPDGCYRLSVTDPAGDGITGYELRETGMNGRRIIDNTGNSITGTSAIANGGTFCLPIGNTSLIYSNCDKMDWVNYQYLVCHEEPLVSAEWQVGNQNNDGYNFWIFDPNGSYSFRRFHTHAVSDGFSPASATRAARIKINGWNNSPLTPHIPTGVMLNVRVRGVYNWNFTEWGPTCTMMIDPVAASCPMIWLQDDPANPSDYSCGVTRNFGGPNGGANKLTAKPPQFQPAPLAGGTGVRYQFRFRIPAEGVCIVRPPQTSPTLYLNWSAASGPQLEASKTYEVEVRASNDQGATWCVDSPSPACDPNPVTNWGRTCDVTISGVVNMDEETSSIAVQGDGGLTMYPNPNRGDQLFVSITELAPEVTTVSVDIYDLTGKRVIARTIAVQDGYLNTTMDLNGDLAGGMYMVNITAGDKAFTERLVIQP